MHDNDIDDETTEVELRHTVTLQVELTVEGYYPDDDYEGACSMAAQRAQEALCLRFAPGTHIDDITTIDSREI
ncbi:hypothetical protein SEA_BANTAM_154 [Gordonia phage Bantam]|uniref:Uncharacterized protein n=1 Tax=Gordonia phage Bantam TaxID=1887641 RepID=A0A1B3AYN5_9CAUD|nr:hypothetical protein BIZ77_gp025 [Gordonia phage Bantam]AOE43843.1 hypothetical protein SEA_BANTAM_154 [Gordonia phage Bantam]